MITKTGKKVLYTNDKVKAKNDAVKALAGRTPTAKEKDALLLALGVVDETGKVKVETKLIEMVK